MKRILTVTAVLAALATSDALAQHDPARKSMKKPRKANAEEIEAVEEAWEEWAERYAARWENWAEGTEDRWEEWAERYESQWEEWAERQEEIWEEFEERMENGEHGDVGEILRLSLSQLENMPIDETMAQATREIDEIFAEGGPLAQMPMAQMEGLDEMIRHSIETALRAAEESIDESGHAHVADPNARKILEQVLSEVQRTSGGVRAAVEGSRREKRRAEASEWRRLRDRMRGRRAAADDEEVHEAIEELNELEQEIDERDRAIQEMRREIEELRREVRRLKRDRDDLRL